MPESLYNAPIAIVDEDRSPLSARIVSSFYPPQFLSILAIGTALFIASLARFRETISQMA